MATLPALQCLALFLQRAATLAVLTTRLVDFFLDFLGALLGFFQLFALHCRLFLVTAHFRRQRLGVQGFLFLAKALHAIAQALDRGFQMLDARLLDLGLATRFIRGVVEAFPLMLPLLHPLFGTG